MQPTECQYGWMRRRVGQLVVMGLLLTMSGIGYADTERSDDSNDARGPLDIEWIKHSHRRSERDIAQLVHTIRLFERWPVDRLKHRGYINLFFDLKGNRDWREERAVYITFENGELRAELFNFGADPPRFMRTVPLWRPDGRTLKVVLMPSDLRRRSFDHYRWFALSFIEEGHSLCGRPGGCDDHAPDDGDSRHDL